MFPGYVNYVLKNLFTIGISFFLSVTCLAHEIVFCGEHIPVENNFVANKLMNVIRNQIPNVNLPELRKRANKYFPVVEYYLKATCLPEDLKYIAIVESAFQNVTSTAGAQGFWQLMKTSAIERGLIVSESVDQRNDIYKSTYAACKHLASNYLGIRKKFGISSWVLTAAAYNYGINNIFRSISRHGNDYFTMELNPETALYVYKIIAVKELFEYPEFYMKDFGYNIFSSMQKVNVISPGTKAVDTGRFNTMQLQVSNAAGKYPDQMVLQEPEKPGQEIYGPEHQAGKQSEKYKYLNASIQGKYKNFKDGQFVTVELEDDLDIGGSYTRKGSTLEGKGWIIDERIFIDLGFSEHYVTILDMDGRKGIELSALKNKQPLLLKVQQTKN